MRKRLKILITAIVLIAIIAFNATVTSTVAMSEPIKEIDLTINHKSVTMKTSARTVKEVLDNIGYQYKSTDRINHELDDRVLDQMAIVVNSEKKVNLSIEGKNIVTKTNAGTVAELLKEEGIEIGENQIVIPSLDSRVYDEETIVVINQSKKTYIQEEEIEYKVEKEYSIDIPYGEIEIIQKGEKGTLEKIYEQVTKNGIIVSNEKISERITELPVNEKILVGTREVVEEEIENETIIKENSSMFVGETKVVQEGHKGVKELVYENDGNNRMLVSEEVIKEPKDRIIEKGTKKKDEKSSVTTSQKYTLSQFKHNGVIYYGGKKFTYYSQSVLPGGGLKIPGRHVNSDGYVADKDGYIVVASNRNIAKGTVIDTPFGYKGKVYDTCASCTKNWFDVYIK